MRIITWLARIFAVLLIFAVIAVLVIFIASQHALSKRIATPPVSPPDLTRADATRGEHLVKAITGCDDCHGANLGGKAVVNDPALGTIYAPNLTSGAGGYFATHDDADFVRAVRYGVASDGRRLLIMPSDSFTELSGEDMADILVYVHSMPKYDGATPRSSVGPLGRLLIVIGALPFPATSVEKQKLAPSQRTIAVTPSYGRYLARAAGCIDCHGVGLSGGHLQGSPSDPPAQNLTPAGDIGHWTFDQYKSTLRTGLRPDGSHLNPFMPWPTISQMTDDELRAIWLYLKSVPPKPTGNG